MPSHWCIILENNCKQELRSWKWTLLEVIVMVALFLLITLYPVVMAMNSKLSLTDAADTQIDENITAFDWQQLYQFNTHHKTYATMAFAPPNEENAYLANQLKFRLFRYQNKTIWYGTDDKKLVEFFNKDTIVAAVHFEKQTMNKLHLKIRFAYEFRTIPVDKCRESNCFWLSRRTGAMDAKERGSRRKFVDLYGAEGFLGLQHHLFYEWLYYKHPDETIEKLPVVMINAFTHKSNQEIGFQQMSINFIWISYYFMYFVPFLNLVWKISRELEEEIPAYQRLYKLSYNINWIVHFVLAMLHLLVLDAIFIGFIKIDWPDGPLLHGSHSDYLLIFLILHNIELILNAFILSTMVQNAETAVWVAAALWLALYGIFSSCLESTTTTDSFVIAAFLVFFNNVLPYGMIEFDTKKSITGIWHILSIQVAAIVLYMAIFIPAEYLTRQSEDICRARLKPKTESSNTSQYAKDFTCWNNFEQIPLQGDLVVVKNVYAYRDSKKQNISLRNISMKLYKDEITIILCPRSSGKTTLLRVLAGWHPYQGNVIYEGNKEIKDNMSYYRQHITVSLSCKAQYDLLTVKEQFNYNILINSRNRNNTQVRVKLNKWLKLLQPFIPDSRIFVKSLNLDQRRLLSLCCTISKNTRFILLDEPTADMTVEAQRFFWRLLRQERLNRVIVVTTHSIDEASEFGDRIAIMNQGSVLAYGTPFFLKSRICHVVYLVVFTNPNTPAEPITHLLRKYVPNVAIRNQFCNRLTYILPADKKSLYQRMLVILESQSNKLGINNIFMTSSDLNDVYTNLTAESSLKKNTCRQSTTFFVESPSKSCLTLASFFRKLLYQAPNIAPIIVMFLVVILIPMLDKLYKHFHGRQAILMGFDPNDETNELFRLVGDKQCNYLQINRIYDTYLKSKNKPQRWYYTSFKCGNGNFRDDLLRDVTVYNNIGAVERIPKKNTLIVWVNAKIFHSTAITLHLAHYMILRDLFPGDTNKTISITNEPSWEPISHKISTNHMSNLNASLVVGIIAPLTMASFVVSLIDERQSHMLSLQMIAGASPLCLWLTGFIWDYVVYCAMSGQLFLVMWIVTFKDYLLTPLLANLLLLVAYGVPSLLEVYTIFLFVGNHKLRGFLKVFTVQTLFGLVAFLAYTEVAYTEPIWFYFLMLSPTFALLVGIVNVSTENSVRTFCEIRSDIEYPTYQKAMKCFWFSQCCVIPKKRLLAWQFPGVLPSIFYMSLSSLLLLAVQMGISCYRDRKTYFIPNRIKNMSSVCYPYNDEHVVAEKLRIAGMDIVTCMEHAVLVDQLELEIPKRGNLAKVTSFAVEKSTGMGIYGGGHSGKSQVIRKLVGEKTILFGEVYICGHECNHSPHGALQHIGYCPQSKGLFDACTPRQLLTLFFMINGISESKCNRKLRDLCHMLHLRPYMSTRISRLPVNIRRRISVAIALIVHNKVLIFDEPTRGLSGADRHLIWNVMKQSRANGNAIVFTSRDSVEIEELADFAVLMDQSEMLAIGSPENVRQRYTLGFYMDIKILADGEALEIMDSNLRKDIENLNRFVSYLHEESELLRHGNILKFYIPVETVKYSYLFGTIEKNRQRLNIAEYLISQGSLGRALDNLCSARKQKIRYEKSNAGTLGKFKAFSS